MIDVLLGFGIGLMLGLLGGGGSILTVPALVYIIGQTPQAAVTTSLAIVGANSAMGAYFHGQQGTLNGRVALLFGGAGIGVAYLAAGLSDHFPPSLLMTIFAGLMLTVGILMVATPQPSQTKADEPSLMGILLSGAGVGLLTGILGVGGGFLIVPALVMLVGLPIQQAVGTSLVVIAMNSIAGFLGHLSGVSIDLTVLLLFLMAGLAGTFTGAKLSHRLPANQLKRGFAIFIIGLAIFLLADHLPNLL